MPGKIVFRALERHDVKEVRPFFSERVGGCYSRDWLLLSDRRPFSDLDVASSGH